jgi:quercetin dioxygenase-like cupin family protein
MGINMIRNFIRGYISKRDHTTKLIDDLHIQIAALKKHTDDFVAYEFIAGEPKHVQMLNLKKGSGFTVGLYKKDEVAVAITTLEPNSVFQYHDHAETEHLIMVSGSMEVINENGIHNLNAAGSIVLEPLVKHCALTKDTHAKFIAITIPANKFYPESK